MSAYEIGLLGRPDPNVEAPLVATISNAIEEFGLQIGRDVIIRSGEAFNDRDRHAACADVTPGFHPAVTRVLG